MTSTDGMDRFTPNGTRVPDDPPPPGPREICVPPWPRSLGGGDQGNPLTGSQESGAEYFDLATPPRDLWQAAYQKAEMLWTPPTRPAEPVRVSQGEYERDRASMHGGDPGGDRAPPALPQQHRAGVDEVTHEVLRLRAAEGLPPPSEAQGPPTRREARMIWLEREVQALQGMLRDKYPARVSDEGYWGKSVQPAGHAMRGDATTGLRGLEGAKGRRSGSWRWKMMMPSDRSRSSCPSLLNRRFSMQPCRQGIGSHRSVLLSQTPRIRQAIGGTKWWL